MPKTIDDRMAARIEGDFVVFLIGMRVNKPWKIAKWAPVFFAMPRMLKELRRSDPDVTGFLGDNGLGSVIVQYWRSFDHLEAYARSHDNAHFPAWRAFNKRMRGARGDVGIWHETYLIKNGQYEAVYSGMPEYGLGRVADLVPATGKREAARDRVAAE